MQIAELIQQDIDGLVQKHRSFDSEKGSAYEKFQDRLLSIDPSADPPKKYRRTMTWDKLKKHLSQGFGMGHGAEYRPWLVLRRKNPSKTSNQLAAHLFPLRRDACFFSRGEYQIALLLLWLGVEDLREQYPLWPIAHPHYVYNSRIVPILMAGQLEWCIDLAFLDDRQHLDPFVERFATEFESTPDLAIADAVVRASEICNLSINDGWTVFRHCAWTQRVDIDLSQPILTSYPANRGGRALRAELRRALIYGWVS